MPTPQELTDAFWKSLGTDMTMMVGLDGIEDGHARPLTAQLSGDEKSGPIWFFTAKDTDLAERLGRGARIIATFASKNHEIFASIRGQLVFDNNRAMIDELWNPYVAAWYEKGKDDPKLALLRLDAERAEIWENASSLMAGIKLLLGVDPKKDYREKVAEVPLKEPNAILE